MKTIVLSLAVLLWLFSSARAELTAIQLSPAAPSVGQPVTATIVGHLPDLCWSLIDYTCGDVAGQEIGITVRTFDCLDQGCPFCYFAEVPIAVSCTFEFETAGTYVIYAREIADTVRSVEHSYLTFSVEVSGGVASDAVTWSTVKSLYR